MNNEEFERKVDFIVNQQAQFAVDIQKLQEAQAATEKEITKAFMAAAHASESADRVSQLVARTVDSVENLSKVVHEGFRYTFESFKRTDAKINILIDSQIRMEEKLQDHIREAHKGP